MLECWNWGMLGLKKCWNAGIEEFRGCGIWHLYLSLRKIIIPKNGTGRRG
jgi:hypothetical protein